VLVLFGKQNIGKTTWVKSLDPANCNAVREGALLDPSNKDSIIGLACHWIIELGELDGTLRKSDIASLKAHITNQVDIVRVPYARKSSRLARRTVYVATVNENRFLSDDTGNRRWWVVEVDSIEMSHGLDMQQVWAETYCYWMCAEPTSLSNEQLKLLNDSNADYEQIDPFEELVLSKFDWSDGWQQRGVIRVRSADVLIEIGYHKPTRSDETRMGKILTKLTGKKVPRRIHVIPQKRMPVPQVCSLDSEG
jgi:putative DNA primase/helicase